MRVMTECPVARNRPNSCLLVRFSFPVVIMCYSLSVLDLAVYMYCCCVRFVSSVLCQEIG